MNKIVMDYHIHSNISPDGKCSMQEMCLAAFEMGLKEITITDHFEFYTKRYNGYAFNEKYLSDYILNIKRCKELFKDKLVIKTGIEFGQPQVNSEYANKIYKIINFDYILGSVHKINNVDLGKMKYYPNNLDYICRIYLKSLYKLVDKADFDCLGHFDLIKRYAARFNLKFDLMNYQEQIINIFNRLIEKNKGIEINTSGLRQEVNALMPSFDILQLYYKLGGRIITIGSDAHSIEEVGKDLDIALDIAKSAGFTKIACFKNRSYELHPII